MQKIPFLQMPRWVPFKKYKANHLEEICNQQNRAKQQLKALDICTKIDWPCGVGTFKSTTSCCLSCHKNFGLHQENAHQ